jgi:cell wall-associated NlpC family hydrolase
MAQGVSGVAVGVLAAGSVLIWAGVRGTSVLKATQDLVQGKSPAHEPQTTPIGLPADTTSSELKVGSASGSQIVQIAASMKGQPYCFGGGHSSFCASCSDCSGYVSCVLHKAGVLNGSPLDTGGLASWGKSVAFADRQPGDVVVWNGGPGGGHCGIVIDATTMWNSPCTGCGGVQIGTYNPAHGSRPVSSAVFRRAA